MSAYEWTDEQLESLQKAIKERLKNIAPHPHLLLPLPAGVKGQDVEMNRCTAEATLDKFRQHQVN